MCNFLGKGTSCLHSVVKTATKRSFSLATPKLDEATYHIGTQITSSTKVWSFKWHGKRWIQVCGSGKNCGQLKGVESKIFDSSYILVSRYRFSSWLELPHQKLFMLRNAEISFFRLHFCTPSFYLPTFYYYSRILQGRKNTKKFRQ